jgi:glycosyltransferase involved in cell wall biosynthesis
VLAAEGPRGLFERALERQREGLRLGRVWEVRLRSEDDWQALSEPAPLLNVMPTPPVARQGGVPIQALRRLLAEARRRPVRLLYPERRGFRLESWGPEVNVSRVLPVTRLEEALPKALELTGAEAIHVENAAGLTFDALRAASGCGRPLVLSLHDFTAFCPRPLLVELPAVRSCGGSQDYERCGRCLAHDGSGDAARARAWREEGRQLLRSARALVFPSEFLRARLVDWLDVPASVEQAVIAPSSLARPPRLLAPDAPARRPRHAAYVGAVRDDKGAEVMADVAARLRGGGLRFSAYGGGDPAALRRLRRAGVRARGYYRAGTLLERLRRDRVDVALLLSVGAETYGLTLDECVAAGIPAVVFDAGAPAERVRAWNAGAVVPLAEGAEGVARVLRETGAWPLVARPRDLPTPLTAAQAHLALYARLGLGTGAIIGTPWVPVPD